MRNLAFAARFYVFAVCVGGVIAFIGSQLFFLQAEQNKLLDLAVFILLALITGGYKVRVSLPRSDDESGSMSLGFAITFAAMVLFGPGPAVLVSAASCHSSCLFPKRQATYQLSFNVCLAVLETFLGSMVFVWMNRGSLELRTTQSFIAVLAASSTYFLVNTFGVATIITLCSKNKLLEVWKENFLWTGLSYLATASVSAFAVFLARDNLTAILICVGPVVFLALQSYKVYVSRAEEKRHHEEDLQHGKESLATLYLAIIKSLALAIDAKDRHTHQHILRVQRYAVAIAREMNLSEAEREVISTGALLHDIGKLGVPEYVLLKPGRLTREEFEMIKKHPEIGAAILSPVEFPWPVLPVVRHHHEKWDGSGYPDGLKGEEIPLSARIMAVADVYDALTSSRSYRRAWTHEKTLETIRADVGTHFDANVVEAFSRVIESVVLEMAREGHGPLSSVHPFLSTSDVMPGQEPTPISISARELMPLLHAAETSYSGLGADEVAEILTKKLSNLFPGALVLILLTKDGEPPLQVSSARGMNEAYLRKARTVNDRSVSTRVLNTQIPFMGEFDHDDLIMSGSEAEHWTDLQDCIIAPLTFGQRKLGTLNVYGTQDVRVCARDLKLLEFIAERVSQPIFNGLAFDRARAQAENEPLTELVSTERLVDFVKARCVRGGDVQTTDQRTLALFAVEVEAEAAHRTAAHSFEGRLAQFLASIARTRGFVSRTSLGGYLIGIEAKNVIEVRTIADQIVGSVHALEGLGRSAYVGIALTPQDGTDWSSLFAAAHLDLCRSRSEIKQSNLILEERAA